MKTPLLDLGNVILRVDFEPFFRWVADRSTIQNRDEFSKISASSLWAEYEFGAIPKVEFIARARKLLQADFSDREFEEKYCDIFPGIVPGMDLFLAELAAAGPVYCLSNTNEMHQERFMREFPLLAQFTAIFASHEIRKRKPYPGTYQDVAREIGVEPKKVLFLDDLRENVEGAKRAGLDAYVFESAEQARKLWQGDKV